MKYSLTQPAKKYYKKTIKYYKCQNWGQPILTSNNSSREFQVSVSSFYDNIDAYNGWASFGANTDDALCWCGDPDDTLPTMDIIFNKKLLIQSIKVKNRATTYSFTENYELQGSNDGEVWETIYIGTCTDFNALSTWTLFDSDSNGVVYNRLRIITKSIYGEGYACIGSITINAIDLDSCVEVPSTDDYTFTEEVLEPYAIQQGDVINYYDKVPHYYKYDKWKQPILTGEKTLVKEGWITCTASSYYTATSDIRQEINAPYCAMDGIKEVIAHNTYWGINGSATGFWQVKFPYKIRIRGITFFNRYSGATEQCVCSGQFYTSSDKTQPIGDAFTTEAINWGETSIQNIPSNGIVTDTIYFDKTGGHDYAGIGELVIDADSLMDYSEVLSTDDYDFILQIPELNLDAIPFYGELPVSEYDYLEETLIPYTFVTSNTKYFKNINDTRYYKYADWVQPIFSSNTLNQDGIFYELTASHQQQPAWWAFNGDTTTGDQCWWTAHGVTSESNPCWITLYSSQKLLINRVDILNEHVSPENFQTCVLQASNDNSTWVNLANINGTDSGSYVTSVTLNPTDAYHYHRLYFTASYSTAGVSIQTLTFYGKEGLSYEVSPSDDYDLIKTVDKPMEVTKFDTYDYSKEVIENFVPTTSKTRYFKYIETDWVQPILGSNGNISTSTMAVYASSELDTIRQAYRIFDGSNIDTEVDCWHSQLGDSGWIAWHTQKPIKICNLQVSNRGQYMENIASVNAIREWELQTSIDGSSWNTLISGENTNYEGFGVWNVALSDDIRVYSNYWRLNINGTSGTYLCIGEITIDALETTSIEVASDDEYDFTIEDYFYKGA